MKAIIFTRVSTADQNNARQIADLTALAERRGDNVVKTFTETISGAKKNAERPVLNEMLAAVKRENVKRIYVTEVSRLGRNTTESLQTVETLKDMSVSVYIQNLGLDTLREDGEYNPGARLVFVVMAEIAYNEREVLRDRIKSGMAQAKADGKLIHRPKGSTQSDEKFKKKHSEIFKYLEKGNSVREIEKLTGKSKATIVKARRLAALDAK